MRTLLNTFGLIAVMVVIPPVVSAQWAPFPTPGVTKNAAGQPDLTAPAPKTPDGKVDLSGIWANGGGGGGGQRGGAAGGQGGARGAAANAAPGAAAPAAGGQGGARGAAGNAAPGAAAPAAGGQGGARGAAGNAAPGAAAPAAGGPGGARGAAATAAPGVPAGNGGPPNATFGNIGSGFPGGLPFQPWAADLVKQRMADNSKDNPDAHCLPMGFMQFHTHPEPRKIVQTPGMVLIIYEANSGLRQIFTDGRPLPGKDAQPWWYGYSVGKWEGDTLVVETTGFIDRNVWLDVRGSPLSDEARVIERFRRPNFGSLEIEVTIDDPKAYTKPFTVKVNQRILLDTELIEFICEDRDATHYVGAEAK